ncbi:hypothetical protein PCANB_001537 [Pneumocystis canis]|nr:hypothetical protein PCK1_001534 [Pneumocystis canis]KAG5439238.1 hypothetical protein PCANB_001537 [Pneumocystis canis]
MNYNNKKLENPFPIYLCGKVIRGYGRGSKELGIPTANISEKDIPELLSYKESGIYYGWGRIAFENKIDENIYAIVMSVGWNIYYNNKKRSAEVHFIHQFENDFYDEKIRVIVMGYIRPERNYLSKELLIQDIKKDILFAKKSLEQDVYLSYKKDEFLFLKI